MTLLLVEADARHNVSFFLRMPVERVDRQNDQLKISMKFNQHITTDAIVMFPNNEISNAVLPSSLRFPCKSRVGWS